MKFTNTIMNFAISLPTEAYNLAEKMSQILPQKKKQVYWGTIATYTVNSYCQFLGIETDFSAPKNWDFITKSCLNIASLDLKHLGIVECIPFFHGANIVKIPRETWENRIGYLGVEIYELDKQALVHKFLPPFHPQDMNEDIFLDKMISLEGFLDHIKKLEIGLDFLRNQALSYPGFAEYLANLSLSDILINLERIQRTHQENEWKNIGGDFLINCYLTGEVIPEEVQIYLDKINPINQEQKQEFGELADVLLHQLNSLWQKPENPPIKLSQWFEDVQNIFESGWQTLEVFKNIYQPELRLATGLRFKSSIPSSDIDKRIAVKSLNDDKVALIANLERDTHQKNDILLQLIPLKNKTLPPNLHLSLLDEDGNLFMEAVSREADNWIQLQFSGMPEDKLSIVVQLDDFEFKSNFEI